MADAAPWRETVRGIAVRVRLTPRAARDEVTGIGDAADGPALLARVRAVPESGSANAALERLVADWLSVPRSSVTLDAGGKSRLKIVAVAGAPASLAARIAAAVASLGPRTQRRK